ncbi:MAG TPA: hypothetical protein VGO57_04290 [Verrucomicrobiae bacterium]|jgi:hypothetical protein
MKLAVFILLCGFCAPVQAQAAPVATNSVPNAGATNKTPTIITSEHRETIRFACIAGRRCLCGKIIQVMPDGLVVDSGYTDLMRTPLTKTWLVPGTVTASRTPNLVEGKEPDCVAVGTVFLTNLPNSRGAKPKLYDYVILTGYPAGYFTYKTIGSVTHTVRRFTGTLSRAVELNVEAQPQVSNGGNKVMSP